MMDCSKCSDSCMCVFYSVVNVLCSQCTITAPRGTTVDLTTPRNMTWTPVLL